jgi:hypothetical protein
MKIIGIIFIVIGLIDLIGSYTGFDLWGGFIGVDLPEMLWSITSFIEIGLGYFIMSMAPKNVEEVAG